MQGSAQRQLAHARTHAVGDSRQSDTLVASVIVVVLLGFGAAILGQINDWLHVRYVGMVTVFSVAWLSVMVCGVGGSLNVNGERIDRDQRPWRFWFDFSLFAVATTGSLVLLICSWLSEAAAS